MNGKDGLQMRGVRAIEQWRSARRSVCQHFYLGVVLLDGG